MSVFPLLHYFSHPISKQQQAESMRPTHTHTFLAFSSTISPHFHKSRRLFIVVKGWGCQFPSDCRRHQMNSPYKYRDLWLFDQTPVIARLTRKTTRVLLITHYTDCKKTALLSFFLHNKRNIRSIYA